MKKDTLINIRVTKSLKDHFQAVVERDGFTMSEILEATMVEIVRRDMIPINIRSKVDVSRQTIVTIPFIKKCIESILSNYKNDKIKSVYLFGSYSKGTADSSSDVDLFLDADEGFDLFDLAGLQMELEKELGKNVDIVTNNDDVYFMNHIQKERIKLYERAS